MWLWLKEKLRKVVTGDNQLALLGQREGYKIIYNPSVPCTTPLQAHKYTHHPSWITGCNIRCPAPPSSPATVPRLMLSVSPPIALHSQLTGPHGTASSSVSVTGRVHPVRHFSAWTHPLILMENVLHTSQHNTTKTWINTKNRLVLFHLFVSLWHPRLFLFMVQVEFEHACCYAAFHFFHNIFYSHVSVCSSTL